MKQGPVASKTATSELTAARIALVGTPIVFAAYAIAFTIGHGSSLRDALPGSAANTIPPVGFGLIAYRIIRSLLVGAEIQINYGTGRDVSDESIADAKEPLLLTFGPSSYLELGLHR